MNSIKPSENVVKFMSSKVSRRDVRVIVEYLKLQREYESRQEKMSSLVLSIKSVKSYE